MPGTPAVSSTTVSPNSLADFTYTAVPATIGQTGVKGFAADARGRLCYSNNGTVPAIVPTATCTAIQ